MHCGIVRKVNVSTCQPSFQSHAHLDVPVVGEVRFTQKSVVLGAEGMGDLMHQGESHLYPHLEQEMPWFVGEVQVGQLLFRHDNAEHRLVVW